MRRTTSLLVECRWFLSGRGNEMYKGVYMGQGISVVYWLSNLTAFHLIIDYCICTLQSRIKLFCSLLSLPTPPDSVNPCGGEVNGVNCCEKKILCKLLLLGEQNSGTSTIYKQVRIIGTCKRINRLTLLLFFMFHITCITNLTVMINRWLILYLVMLLYVVV